jgi:hypothetical protein
VLAGSMARSAASARASAAAEWEQVAAQVASLEVPQVSAADLSEREPAEYSAGLASQASFQAWMAPVAYPALKVLAADLSALEPVEYSVAPASRVSFPESMAPDAYPASLVWFQA